MFLYLPLGKGLRFRRASTLTGEVLLGAVVPGSGERLAVHDLADAVEPEGIGACRLNNLSFSQAAPTPHQEAKCRRQASPRVALRRLRTPLEGTETRP
jgi:hypothetical protein